MVSEWPRKTRGSSRAAASFKSLGSGCSTLVDMAIQCVLTHSSNLTAESLDGLPWEIAGLVWQKLVNSYVVASTK